MARVCPSCGGRKFSFRRVRYAKAPSIRQRVCAQCGRAELVRPAEFWAGIFCYLMVIFLPVVVLADWFADPSEVTITLTWKGRLICLGLAVVSCVYGTMLLTGRNRDR